MSPILLGAVANLLVEGIDIVAPLGDGRRCTVWPLRDRRLIHTQLARIVCAAHEAAVFDLDLHAGNVLVTDDSRRRPRAVLFDFNKIHYA